MTVINLPNREMTICFKCKHHRRIGSTDIWYDQVCLAHRRQPAVDPVTGKKGFGGVNDLGREYFTDQGYLHCRDINDGACSRFERK